MEASDYLDRPALAIASAIANGLTSSVEVVQAVLDRIVDRNTEVNAFAIIDRDVALRAAARSDIRITNEGPSSPLDGIPIAIKDIVATRDMRTTYGSRAFADNVPADDAATVRRIREAGMVIIGKTNTPEFAALPLTVSELLGACHNPWDHTRNAGGSSGGAAAAVAAGMLPIAHGSDASGSIRLPAAWCGVFGLKPSRGRISLAPFAGERLAGIATEGPICRTVADAAALLDILAGYEVGDPYWLPPPERPFLDVVSENPGRLRIAVATHDPSGVRFRGDHLAALDDAAATLEERGHDVEPVDYHWATTELTGLSIIWGTLPVYYSDPDPSLLEPSTRARMDAAAHASARDYVRARLELERAARHQLEQWSPFDVLLAPVTTQEPVADDFLTDLPADARALRAAQLFGMTREFNVTGQPAATLPIGIGAGGMPRAVQIVAGPGRDDQVLQISRQLEQVWPPMLAP